MAAAKAVWAAAETALRAETETTVRAVHRQTAMAVREAVPRIPRAAFQALHRTAAMMLKTVPTALLRKLQHSFPFFHNIYIAGPSLPIAAENSDNTLDTRPAAIYDSLRGSKNPNIGTNTDSNITTTKGGSPCSMHYPKSCWRFSTPVRPASTRSKTLQTDWTKPDSHRSQKPRSGS